MFRRSGAHGQGDSGNPLIRSNEDYEHFEERFDRYERSAIKWPPPVVGRAQPERLQSVVQNELKRLLRYEDPAWSCLVISVDEGDGKTWSAAAVDREVARHAAAVDRYQLTPDRAADGFPQIVELVSKRKLIQIAQESGAAPPSRRCAGAGSFCWR